MVIAMKKSTNIAIHGTIGKISLGKYTFVKIPAPVIRLLVDFVTEVEKYSQGTNPAYTKSGYGMPSLGIFANPLKTIKLLYHGG